MTSLRLRQFDSLAVFRADAARWDDLWLRSDVALPTTQAELVADWVEQFSPRERFCAWAVEDGGRLVAGLALVGGRIKRLVRAGRLPRNPWSQSGELWLDPAAETSAVLRLLLTGLRQAPWPLIWLDDVPLDAPRWRQFSAAAEEAGWAVCRRTDYQVGTVEVPDDWDALEEHWSRNHRHKLRRIDNKLERMGSVDLYRPPQIGREDVPALLRRAFEIEDRSWKNGASTSVLRQPGMFDYYCRIARRLAAADQLDLALLSVNGEDIAFLCGSRAKGTCFTSKIGYDERFAAFSPGNALLHRLLRQGHAGNGPRRLDFSGPLSDWTARFATGSYPVGRLILAPGKSIGRLLLRGYERCRPKVREGEKIAAERT